MYLTLILNPIHWWQSEYLIYFWLKLMGICDSCRSKEILVKNENNLVKIINKNTIISVCRINSYISIILNIKLRVKWWIFSYSSVYCDIVPSLLEIKRWIKLIAFQIIFYRSIKVWNVEVLLESSELVSNKRYYLIRLFLVLTG